MRKVLQVASVAAISATLLTPTVARATEEFPTVISGELNLDYRPDCGLCHNKGNTGMGTAITPFALAMKDRGLEPGNAVTLRSALDAMVKDGVDSDGDSATDIEELSVGTNPNSASPEASIRGGEDPQYGCSIGRADAGQIPALGAAAAMALLLWRRRSRTFIQGVARE